MLFKKINKLAGEFMLLAFKSNIHALLIRKSIINELDFNIESHSYGR